jgi:hypothetical protein
MQVIEVHYVVMHILRTDHQVPNQLGIFRDFIIEGILNGPHRGDAMNERADATDTLGKCPGITRVAPLEDDFDTANHRAG